MMRRLRLILPPDWTIIAFVLIFVLTEGPIYYVEQKFGQPVAGIHPGIILARIAAFAFGLFRVRSFHPALNPEYRSWLERTPWTIRKPLPGGPVTLVWGDILVLGGLAASVAAWGLPEVLAVLSLALIGYLCGLTIALGATGDRLWKFAVGFLIGLAVYFWPDRPACLAASIAGYLVGWVGLQRSLARFPWPPSPIVAIIRVDAKPSSTSCGWPFDQLRPQGPQVRTTDADRIMAGLLGGWYFLAAESVILDLGLPIGIIRSIFIQFLGITVVGRIATYMQGYAAPVGLMGRIRSFRWIIPGYDQIFVAPICMVLIGVLAIDRFRPPGISEELILPIALAMALIVSKTVGPDLERWRLTGNHRIVVTSLAKSTEELVQVG